MSPTMDVNNPVQFISALFIQPLFQSRLSGEEGGGEGRGGGEEKKGGEGRGEAT